ncbi:FecR family protein [uncultured Sanguibacteroides sp.]|uniref:FecR family protein n=1 Tax=uncultured Sanguibacteroides sp. TaxID=1635151 RepID=UPI0025D2B594|nr:FecR family protein [uncultured Sanguibacteroides sp.]
MDIIHIKRIRKIIVKQLIGEISEPEKRLLDEWLLRSEENRKLFERVTSGEFVGHAITDDHTVDRQKVWRKIERQTVCRRWSGKYRNLIRVAAVVLVLIGVGLYYMVADKKECPGTVLVKDKIVSGKSKAILELANGNKIVLENDTTFRFGEEGLVMVNRSDTLDMAEGGENKTSGEYHTIRIPRGGEYVARLSEGTVVCLNAESELRVPVVFDTNTREVYFNGEGYFSVAKDAGRPFIIHTGGLSIKVLGTEFVLRSYRNEEEIITTLVKGAVEVTDGRDSCRLLPNHQARVNRDGQMSVKEVDVYRYMAWTTGRMVFENERLETIMDELSRWYDVDVFYSSQDLKNLRFTMDVKKYSDLDKFTALMEKTDKVSFRIKDRTVVVSKQ